MEKSQCQHSAPHSGERRDEEVAVSGSTGGTGGEDGRTHTQASGAGKEQLLVDEDEVNNPWLQ